ncbi:MAG: rhodanese-like domain-containing protein [Clostridiales bacterium]|jgi:phage shock protein E|nr:rhodanese-like domain-containing protein [Clostridiales bacterium]
MFGLLKNKNSISMKEAEQELRRDPSIVLVDVRSRTEYREGHIPNSWNIPLDQIKLAAEKIKDKNSRLFVYCLSGGRSATACMHLEKMGYANVTNIGGISKWTGEIERS